jgi:hypothetical protein
MDQVPVLCQNVAMARGVGKDDIPPDPFGRGGDRLLKRARGADPVRRVTPCTRAVRRRDLVWHRQQPTSSTSIDIRPGGASLSNWVLGRRVALNDILENDRNPMGVAQRQATLRLAWQGLAFSLGPRKLVVSRKRGPQTVHLTLSYGNVSGELDIHIKRDPPDPGQDEYLPLLKVPEERFAPLGKYMHRTAERYIIPTLDLWKPVDPCWLWRRGYWITVADSDEVLKLLRAFVPEKHHGKHRLTFAPMDNPDYWQQFAQFIVPGWLLRYATPDDVKGPITATSFGKIQRPTLVVGWLRRADGGCGWMVIRQDELVSWMDQFAAALLEDMAARIAPDHARIADAIIAELGLEEVADLADLVQSVRAFLRAPQDLSAKVNRQAGLLCV